MPLISLLQMHSQANVSRIGQTLSYTQAKVQTAGCQILHESKFSREGSCHNGEKKELGDSAWVAVFLLFQRVAPSCKIVITLVFYCDWQNNVPTTTTQNMHLLISRICYPPWQKGLLRCD